MEHVMPSKGTILFLGLMHGVALRFLDYLPRWWRS